MTWQTVGQFLQMYWALMAFCGGVIWHMIKMYFGLRNVKEKMVQLATQLQHHDDLDKEVEQTLTNLINRNKDATEHATNAVQQKLESIGQAIAELKTLTKLLIDNKIK